MNSKSIYNATTDWCDRIGYPYTKKYDDKSNYGEINTQISCKGKFQMVDYRIEIEDEFCLARTFLPIRAYEEDEIKTMILISYINSFIKSGAFVLKIQTGEIFYRVGTFLSEDTRISDETISDMLLCSRHMLSKYGDAFANVLCGNMDPKEAFIEAIEIKDKA
ncbi:MAG: hypothetical protein K6G03_10940 [Lachnospiraceae bacterium]|nr:hypothetical protein [Lachnospiraceae bacterium]